MLKSGKWLNESNNLNRKIFTSDYILNRTDKTLTEVTTNQTMTSTDNPAINHQCHSISDIANEAKQRYGSIDTGYLCDICKKTKFTYSGAGHICFNCKLRCCVRCAFKYTTKTKV